MIFRIGSAKGLISGSNRNGCDDFVQNTDVFVPVKRQNHGQKGLIIFVRARFFRRKREYNNRY